MDLSNEAIKSCKDCAETDGILHSDFYQADITDAGDVVNVVEHAGIISAGSSIVFYSRFVMHSIDDEQEAHFITALSDVMIPGERVYFEFRSKEDEVLEKHYGGHYRRYVDTAAFSQGLEIAGLSIDYSMTG
jgi:tellurite methyltransferase